MNIDQISSGAQAASGQGQQQANSSDKLGQDQFLQLLVAQMQNQDPINPMDSKEFASQLAQFNSVEQLIGVNESLTGLRDSQELMRMEMTNSMAASLTGKQVRALSNQVNLEAGENVELAYELNTAADEVVIEVKDSSGDIVRSETLNSAAKGENSWSWDGKNDDGIPAPEGPYSVDIKAANGDRTVKARMFTEGVANRVRFTGDGVLIAVDGIEIPIGNIETVGIKNP